MLLDLTTTTLVEWSRWQFAMTAIYHYMFVPLTLGLALMLAIMETMWVKTGDQSWLNATKFWMKLFGINFAIGVATGLILEFQFGTPVWRALVDHSKFSKFSTSPEKCPEAYDLMLQCGKQPGYIGMQDHGYGVCFRNIRIKEL